MIFGAGSLAVLARAYLTADSDFRPVAFSVDRPYMNQDELDGLPLVPSDQLLQRYPPSRCSMLVAVGYRRVNAGRIDAYERCREMGYGFITYVSSHALRAPGVEVGPNTFIFEAAVLQPGAQVGANCVLWSGCQVLHDTVVEDHCFIGANVVIGGNVTVGTGSFLGLNATIRDHVKLAPSTVVGAGAVIKFDTEPGAVYSAASTPAHPTRTSSDLDNL